MLKQFIFFPKNINLPFLCAKILAGKTFPTIPSKNMSSKLQWDVKGILLDITGVLYESGQGAIKGSAESIEKLRQKKIPFRFVTNETQRTRPDLVSKLNSIGFSLSESEILSPGIVTSAYLKKMNLRPFLLVHPQLVPEFSDCDQTSPNCVVVGDAAENFSYENMNKAFQILLQLENPILISMGKGKFYKEKGEIVMDLGGFTAALEFAVGIEAKVIGKPSPDYFTAALEEMGVSPNQAVMVGDDINSDVHAAQKCGMKGVLVKTGKFRESDMNHPVVKPDAIVDNLAHFVDSLL
ncbi:phospholysine phosphohistidine inorganic pyrophosphate phosphatase [Trichonephila clavata]|uniref:Phospholysine phosphohistidine inorganic pyrophosphate phosphatase n=1 Tax=Trichonephila clavata TaxID=2740835 RepID=A0A8X6GUT2_TRICU|nr:phospholysine phosphohistidine inorganic pyrophosphate phosphatase [Trichonephila clavata]